MSDANSVQIGGGHYKADEDKARRAEILKKIADGKPLEHWDIVYLMQWDYFQGCATKYIHRYRGKNGVQDLDKAIHFLQKMKEILLGEQTLAKEEAEAQAQAETAAQVAALKVPRARRARAVE